MADFINTIDVLGDSAVEDSILARTITEFKDNRVTKVGGYAFYGCTALTEVDLPNATSIADNGFNGCKSLVNAYVPSVTTAGSYAFANCTGLVAVDLSSCSFLNYRVFEKCTALQAVILRYGSVCRMDTTNTFNNSSISSGTGYIYVPAALVDSYKAATNWSTYAAQIRAIEDYPDITGG